MSAGAAAALLSALAPWGAASAGAWPTAADSDTAVARAPQRVAPPVILVQRVAPQVTIEALTDDRISAKGADLVAISTTGSNDVPDVAMRAYKSAAEQMASIRPECQIPWTLLAGIGRVESDHGRYGGSALGVDGLPRPAIRGVALNGVGPVAAIPDSDNGRFDDDKVWDRAVGPMQFIPTTWDYAGRDGDGDGVSDPNDIDDAALAAADYLCPSSGSILSDSALSAAVFSYNHSDYYVALVLAFKTGYETGVFNLPSPPVEETDEKKKAKKKDRKKTDEAVAGKRERSAAGKDSGGSTQPKASPKPPTKPQPKAPTKPAPTKPKPTTSPTPPPTAPTATPSSTPTDPADDDATQTDAAASVG